MDVGNIGPRDQVIRPGAGADGFNYPIMKSFTFGLSIGI
jgi:hypothetical protein